MRKLTKCALALSTALLVTSCESIEKKYEIPTYRLVNSFDAVQAGQLIMAEGTAKIKGNALLKQKGGTVVTCAGNDVSLIPYTEYANERLTVLYRNAAKGYNPYYGRIYKFSGDEQNYKAYQKHSTCDSDGKFEFDNLKEGTYFVITSVTWKIQKYISKYSKYPTERTEGGNLIQKVQVKQGETKNIVMTY